MILLYIAGPLGLLGLTMWTRGLIYTLKPEGGMAKKRQKRNLKYGFTTDMLVFGRKVRRLGFMITLVAAGLAAWHFSGEGEELPAASSTEGTGSVAE